MLINGECIVRANSIFSCVFYNDDPEHIISSLTPHVCVQVCVYVKLR